MYRGNVVARGGRKDLDDLFQNFAESGLLFFGLVVVIGIGLWVVSWIRSRLADDEGSHAEDHRLLTQIADLKEQGDLSEEEYRSIKGRLVERIDDSTSADDGRRNAPSGSETEKSAESDDPVLGGGDSDTRDASGG